MRLIIRHAIALLFFSFICKVAIEAQSFRENAGVPKSLLLGSLAPEQPIPNENIDPRPIISAITHQ